MPLDPAPVSKLTAAAVGEPGDRTFYLQARSEHGLLTLLCEKQQVALLSAHVDQLLERVGAVEPDDPAVPDQGSLDLEEPVEPSFRVGQIGLGYDSEHDLCVLECEELVPEGEEGLEPKRATLLATRHQMFALARKGEREVAAGRPVCSMCHEPIDPEGHFCARSNGHREISELG
jgi:uncharacterized repeat protein (TIGR03847 family)